MKFSNRITYLQQGGPMPEEGVVPEEAGMAPEQGGAPVPEQGGQDQMMAQVQEMAMQIIQQLGPDAAAMLAQAIMEILQGGGQEQLPPPEQQPVYQRLGGRIQRIR